MARVKFSADFDYTWPSRAMTFYPNNWEGSVKEEVAAAAVAAGKARRTRLVAEQPTATTGTTTSKRKPRRARRVEGIKGGKIDQAEPEPTLNNNLPVELAEPQALTPNLHDPDNS